MSYFTGISIYRQQDRFIYPGILWPPHAKSWLIGKDSDAGRDRGQEKKGTTEDEMAGWHHWFNGHESEWTLTVGDRRGGLACCNSCSCKESDMTERLIWSDPIRQMIHRQVLRICFCFFCETGSKVTLLCMSLPPRVETAEEETEGEGSSKSLI